MARRQILRYRQAATWDRPDLRTYLKHPDSFVWNLHQRLEYRFYLYDKDWSVRLADRTLVLLDDVIRLDRRFPGLPQPILNHWWSSLGFTSQCRTTW